MVTITLERRFRQEVQQQAVAPQPEPVIAALRQLDGRSTASLILEEESRQLLVGGGPDRFNVLARLGYDDFYDLVGDPSLHGLDEVMIGDQLTPVPRRHLVCFSDAQNAILEFLETGTIQLSTRWERQGEFQQP
jgi:hypothetical protein